jgi:biopolymer transport protein ExbB
MKLALVRSALVVGVLASPIAGHAADGSPTQADTAAQAGGSSQPSAAPQGAGTPPAPIAAQPEAGPPAATAPQLQTPPQTPTAPVAAPAQAEQPATSQVVSNPYGLSALWAQGDFIARGTLLVLAIMSASSWYVLVTKIWEQSRLFLQARKANRNFWTASSVDAGIAALPAGTAFYAVANSGVDAANSHGGSLVENIDLNTWVAQSIHRAVDQIVSRLQGGLAILATVGSIAPFVGLFGTVWGIYHALTAIGIAGQASIDKVAGPVGEALIMTAIGLAVAVPAVLGYNWVVRRNKVAVELVRNFGSDLHSVLLGGARPGATARAAGVANKPLARAA